MLSDVGLQRVSQFTINVVVCYDDALNLAQVYISW